MTQPPDAPEESPAADLPVVRLKPKSKPQAIRRGYPWIYADELVTDRRTKALAPGTIARLEDAERTPLARVAVNPNSKIIARVIDREGRGGLRGAGPAEVTAGPALMVGVAMSYSVAAAFLMLSTMPWGEPWPPKSETMPSFMAPPTVGPYAVSSQSCT